MAQLDMRPRNPEHERKIKEMFNPERLQYENTFDSMSDLNSEHSVDECLDDTDLFREWARKQTKGTNLDPEIRKPIQITNSRISDYKVEFTRIDPTINTPSSISSLSIPQISNASLTLNSIATPKAYKRRSRQSVLTPKQIMKTRLVANAEARLSIKKRIPPSFSPKQFSTPVRNEPRKMPLFKRTVPADKSEIETPTVSSSIDGGHEDGEVVDTTSNEKSNKTLTNENKGNDPVSTTIVPETQQNNSVVIPETQDDYVPETQDDYVPETQDDYIPETQNENEIPKTQNDLDINPVQAQVSQKNQAEPRTSNFGRIQSRPPIRRHLQNGTPSRKVPLNTTISKPIPKTPSRLPIPIQQTPKPIRSTALTPAAEKDQRTNSVVVSSTNSQNVKPARIIIVHTPTKNQPMQLTPAPQAIVPASNVTVNVNLNNPIPQSPPQQTTQTICTNDQNVENANSNMFGGNKRNSTNDSVMTNDSDSNDGNRENSMERCDTPKPDKKNISAKRTLFTKDDVDHSCRSINKVDNVTRAINAGGDSIASPMRTRQKNSMLSNAPSIIAPNSQTFVKPKASIQNATYDVVTEHASSRLNGNSNIGYISSIGFGGSTFNHNAADVPSDAILEPLEISYDESNGNSAKPSNDKNAEQQIENMSIRRSQRKKCISTSTLIDTSIPENVQIQLPTVRLDRLPMDISDWKSSRLSKLRASMDYKIAPPIEFQNDDDSIIRERSPLTSRREFNEKQNESMPLNTTNRKKSIRRSVKPKNEHLVVVEKNLKEIENKPSSKKSHPRRLRSSFEFDDIDVDVNGPAENVEAPKTNANMSMTNDSVFKKPNAPAPRLSRSNKKNVSRTSAANVSGSKLGESQVTEEDQQQEELVLTVNIEPMHDEKFDANDELNNSDESVQSSSKQTQKSRPPKGRSTTTKQPNRTKAKKSEVTQHDESEHNANASIRRSSKRTQVGSGDVLRNQIYIGYMSKMPHETHTTKAKVGKRKTVDLDNRHTAPVLPLKNDPEREPPKKKHRAHSEIAQKMGRPSNNKTLKSETFSESGSNGRKSEATLRNNSIAAFTESLPSYITRKIQQKEPWWRYLVDIEQKNPIIHNEEDTDAEHINTKYGRIEISSTDKIAYTELDGVDYGFVPSASRARVCFMRFPPKTVKAKVPSHAEFELHVLYGEFILQYDEGEIEIFAGTDVTIPQGAVYGLVNITDDIGILHCTYATGPDL